MDSRLFTAFLIVLFLFIFVCACFAGSEPEKEKAVVQVVGNSECPVSGKVVGGKAASPTFYSDFRGYRIGFMCPVCKGKFDSADETGKLEYLNKALKSVGKQPVK